jgi:hypothetical protein
MKEEEKQKKERKHRTQARKKERKKRAHKNRQAKEGGKENLGAVRFGGFVGRFCFDGFGRG